MSQSPIKQVEVQIMGQSYLLACPEDGEQALLDAVARVDAAMCRIRDAGKVKARDRIAVLAAINIAFEQAPRLAASVSRSAVGDEGGTASSSEPSGPALDALLRRLDAALGHDGQLI